VRTIITHFYNESYLLPWWLKHHVEWFDNGVLINHASTDDSLDICRSLAPHWTIADSQLTDFDAYMNDFEVMKHEERIPGFKIALTMTEFLVPGAPLAELERRIVEKQAQAAKLPAVILVDDDPSNVPSHGASLIRQKHHGYIESQHPELGPAGTTNYGRIYHRSAVGQYYPGRHHSYLYGADTLMEDIFIFKYTFSPWNPAMKQRKLQIGDRVSAADRQRSWGWQHQLTVEQLDELHAARKAIAFDLTTNPAIGHAIEQCA